MASDEPPNPMAESGVTIRSDSEQYSSPEELSTSPPSSSSPAIILYQPPTFWSILRGAAINLVLPFINGMMLGFGELFAHEAAFRLGWSNTRIPDSRYFHAAICSTTTVTVPRSMKTLVLGSAAGPNGNYIMGQQHCTLNLVRETRGPGPVGHFSERVVEGQSGFCLVAETTETKMPPSRGFLTSSPSLGLARTALHKPSSRFSTRQFGTALRTNGVVSQNSRALSGRRIGGPITFTAAMAQSRYASTQPPVSPTPSPAVSGPVDSTANPSLLSNIDSTPISLSGSDLLNMPEQIGFLKSLGLDYGWGPTSMMESILEHTYVWTGLPWWASICLVSLGIRAVLVKPMFTAAEMAQKVQDLKANPVYEALDKEIKGSLTSGIDQYTLMDKRNKMKVMQRAAGYRMLPATLPAMLQIPLGFGMFRLIRGMADLPVPSMETGGALWFNDLTVSDPLFILPIIATSLMIASMRVPLPYMAKAQQGTMKIITLVAFPITLGVGIFMPAGLQLYFAASTLLQFSQQWLTYQNWFRKIIGLKPVVFGGHPITPLGGAYQAPRILDVKGTVAEPKKETFFESLKSTKEVAMEKLNNYQSKSTVKSTLAKAQDYEEKRALEEKERMLARRQSRRERNRGA
ncbi:60Kd inner membrane protein-domain-containing protein [Apiosordaria backusii]|uniref:60Kd inner membrane protein-domain-containing protein n=1 Tax=Apiosordaria backusii TaxID=314023 RepID=A0AA40EFC7_9PEZI|nr:60Kd inner membrane protein-domain-containing protein [Apiosordaria backusii]